MKGMIVVIILCIIITTRIIITTFITVSFINLIIVLLMLVYIIFFITLVFLVVVIIFCDKHLLPYLCSRSVSVFGLLSYLCKHNILRAQLICLLVIIGLYVLSWYGLNGNRDRKGVCNGSINISVYSL
jgi:hypothetical protein